MKLGELSWEIALTEFEKDRLSSAVSNPAHAAHDVLRDFLRKTSQFSSAAKSLQKKIHGFRPNSEGYNERAASLIIQDIGSNKAPIPGWGIYREAIALYFEKEVQNMYRLMQEVEIEWDKEQFNNAETSELFMNTVCKAADRFDVLDTDVQLLYELWPVERQENIQQLIDSCPKYDPVRELEKKIERLQMQVEGYEASSKKSIARAVEGQVTVLDMQEMLHESELKIQRKFDQSIGKDVTNLSGNLHRFGEQKDASIEQLRQEILAGLTTLGDLQTTVDENRKLVDETRSQLEGTLANRQTDTSALEAYKKSQSAFELISQVRQDLEVDKNLFLELQATVFENRKLIHEAGLGVETKSRSETTSTQVEGSREKEWSPFESLGVQAQTNQNLPLIEMTEAEFLHKFLNACKIAGVPLREEELTIIHYLLKTSSVVVSRSTKILDIWINTLNWHSYAMRMAASPTWSSPIEWEVAQRHLLSSANPAVSYILDFDSGLIDGYLEPALRIWSDYEYSPEGSKLFLIHRSHEQENPIRLRTPALYLDSILQGLSDFGGATSQLVETNLKGSISRSCLVGWSSQVSNVNEALLEHESLFEPILDCNIEISDSLSKLLFHARRSIEPSHLPHYEKDLICLESIALPWVERTYETTKSAELKAYVNSRRA